jgi:hypothetical protein
MLDRASTEVRLGQPSIQPNHVDKMKTRFIAPPIVGNIVPGAGECSYVGQ